MFDDGKFKVHALDFDGFRAIGVLSGHFTLDEAQQLDPHDVGSKLPVLLRAEVWELQRNGGLSWSGSPDVPPDTSCADCGGTHRAANGQARPCPRPLVEECEFTVEVDFTDRQRTQGGFVTSVAVVTVLDESDTGATLTAAQMVAGMLPRDFMVTATRVIAVCV